tara:strand:+ start:648 stop:1088 length:441 start_codon:yes stop_codon:yes gene_type:complete
MQQLSTSLTEKEFFLLTPETASDELIGYKVTIGIRYETPTQYGVIEKLTEDKMHIRVGANVKKFDYDPENIILQVYQFDKGVRFISKSELERREMERYYDEVRQQAGAEKVASSKKNKKTTAKGKKSKTRKSKAKTNPKKKAIEWS